MTARCEREMQVGLRPTPRHLLKKVDENLVKGKKVFTINCIQKEGRYRAPLSSLYGDFFPNKAPRLLLQR